MRLRNVACFVKIDFMITLNEKPLLIESLFALGGEGCTPLYKPYRYVPPHHRFLRRFGLGLHFAHFGLESGMVFEETVGVYERIYSSCQFRMNKKEREMCQLEVDFKKSFLLAF